MEESISSKAKKGTTTVALQAKDAVVLAADMKATMGNLVESTETEKIFQIDDKVGFTMAGYAGDGQALARLLSAEARLFKLQENEPMGPEAVITLLANILNSRKFYPYFVQLIIGGVENSNTPRIYDIDLAGGTTLQKNYAATGSGSPIALGVFEDSYKPNLDLEEAKKLAVRAVKAARQRDIYTGGKSIKLVTITRQGYKEHFESEVEEIIKQLK